MASKDTLQDFVKAALAEGQSRENISAALTDAGWEKSDVKKALAAFHVTSFPVPVPSKRYSLAARDTVFYLFHFTALYLASFGIIFLGLNILELMLPLSTDYMSADVVEGRVRYWLAWTIVFTPVYLFVAWKAELRIRRDPLCLLSNARQWLTYLTLFVASMTALGDLVALLYGFLQGEMTIRFFLKVIVVGTVSGAVLAYYYYGIRRLEDNSDEVEL